MVLSFSFATYFCCFGFGWPQQAQWRLLVLHLKKTYLYPSLEPGSSCSTGHGKCHKSEVFIAAASCRLTLLPASFAAKYVETMLPCRE